MLMYGVWFVGTENEPAGICWQYRKPFLADTEIEAALFREEMQQSSLSPDALSLYKICKIEILDQLKILVESTCKILKLW